MRNSDSKARQYRYKTHYDDSPTAHSALVPPLNYNFLTPQSHVPF